MPYGAEVHATRYQYGFALTPGALRKPDRAAITVNALCALGEVAGNHGRFLYDFSPESAVFRVTHDPAPRILYVFHEDEKVLCVRQGQDSLYGSRAAHEGDVVVVSAGEVVLSEDLPQAGAVHERQTAQVQDDVAHAVRLRS